jgi:hypothetical protein
MLYLPIGEIEWKAADLGFRLCAKCKTFYQPCAAVQLCWDEWDRVRYKWRVLHIAPKAYVFVESGKVWDSRYGVRFCDWESGKLTKLERCSVFFARHPLLVEARGEFEKWMLQRYPELVGQPWTKPVFDCLGIDLEAEIAMWLLSQ